MNYTKDGKIKPIKSDELYYSHETYDLTGTPRGMTQSFNNVALLDLLNDLIEEINSLKKSE